MFNLEDLLAEDENDLNDASNLEIDDILNESDNSIKDLNIEKANQILSEKKQKLKVTLKGEKKEYEELILKYIEQEFEQQYTEEVKIEISSNNEDEIEPQSLIDQIDKQERIIKETTLENVELINNNIEIENIEIQDLQLISNQLKKLSGQPCLLAFQFNLLSIGTSIGEILVYSASNDDFIVLKYNSKVSAIDNTQSFLVAGYEDCAIILWDPNTKSQLKQIKHQEPLLSLKFFNENQFIISDYLGQTSICKITKMLWSHQIEIEKLMPRQIHPFYQISIWKQEYIAFSCLEQVIVMKVDQQSQIIKRIKRQIDGQTYPCTSWGQFTNTEEYTEMVEIALAVSWGTHIEIYIVEKQQLIQKYSFILNTIISCNWLSRDMLVVLTKEFQIVTLNTQFFNRDIITEDSRNTLRKQMNYLSNKTEKAIQSITPLGDIMNFPLQINNGQQMVSVYVNCITSNARFIYILTLPLVKRIKLQMWSDYLKVMIDKAETKQNWYDILSFGITLYWNQVHCFALPQTTYDQRVVFSDISIDICRTFINLVGQSIESQKVSEQFKYEEWSQTICQAIQYCIHCNQQQYIFTGMKTLLIKFHRYSQLLASLEEFILTKQIKQIPNDLLLQISTHYKVINKSEIVEQLILSLDPKGFDMTTIFQICQENDLYTPLMVVCPRIDHDYITPLQKMYSNFLKTKNQIMLLKSLWFIQLTFQQILFPNERIPQDRFQHAFEQVIMWLLIEDILTIFGIHFPKELFEILKIAMNYSSYFNSQQLQKYFNHQKPILVAFINKIYQSLSQLIVTHHALGIEFSKFIGSIKGMVLYEEIYVRSLKHLVSDSKNFQLIINILEQFDLKPLLRNELFELSNDNYIKSLFAPDIYKQIDLCLMKINKKYFMLWLERQLNLKREQTLKALDFYFDTLLGNSQTLQILKQIVPTLSTQEQYKLMKREQITDGYMELFQSLGPSNKDLRTLLITACCIHTPHQVLDKIHNFALDDLEIIFLETKHKEGLGYIYARVGKFDMAMKFFIQNLLDYLHECFTLQSFSKEILNLKFDLLFQTCKDNLSHNDKNTFLEIGHQLFNQETHSQIWALSEQITKQNYQNMIPILQVINTRLCEFYNFLSIEELINLMEEQIEIFRLVWIKWSFKNLIYDERVKYRIQYKSYFIELQTYLGFKQQIFHQNASSPEIQNVCSNCDELITIDQHQHILIRKCSHSTHQSCLQQPFCHICNPKVKMQLESVLANRNASDGVDMKRRQILIKENEIMKVHYMNINIEPSKIRGADGGFVINSRGYPDS
ncbi:unnamed protein product (macronuclear) [Paramecium tetraurelia]|uniref:Vacuolar protein sorting-associated protein 8 central domain-containing protein n=1 Tax=Paramecium tetraurelia TaxID=5888 RepID=A0C476_PARTE|nr:uncharacterized protein GSPATT00035073001 [Paramecium tetraurelia]CAK65593.1 unnamed protein product [Paramecium tetraurelia]|eukprot:XP_001432990.1 hypothetical protein (macronuclear) [Paramecium tetraurelia strain d4-2]